LLTEFFNDILLLINAIPTTFAKAEPPMQNPITAANAKLQNAKSLG